MAISQEFREAVDSKKLVRVRIMLKDSLLVDPTLDQFEQMEKYAASVLDDLYVPHDGTSLNFDVTSWNENYLNEQMVAVVSNFSKERIDLLKSMVRQMYKEKANKIRDDRQTQTSTSLSRKQIGTGVTVAGAALAVAGVCTSHGILIAGGVAVAAAGIVLIVTDKESK